MGPGCIACPYAFEFRCVACDDFGEIARGCDCGVGHFGVNRAAVEPHVVIVCFWERSEYYCAGILWSSIIVFNPQQRRLITKTKQVLGFADKS